jgi:hypothetical protein
LAALAPDVLVAATGSATVAPLLQATRTVPIVFVVVGNRGYAATREAAMAAFAEELAAGVVLRAGSPLSGANQKTFPHSELYRF